MRAARLVLALSALVAAACGGKSSPGESVCDNTVPPPAACMTACDPMPGAANTCPAGYHCREDGTCDAVCLTNADCGGDNTCTPDGRCKGPDDCEGLECDVVDCAKDGMPETTISGTVYAPNGTLPLYGITVYIPNAALPPLPDGAQCSRCGDNLPGSPLVQATTDEAGHFTLTGNVPAGADIPLVITSGKWRRQVKITTVAQCTDTALVAEQTRLPKDRSEGDIPKIALSTGSADSIECLLRRMGIADSEIGKQGTDQRIHLYTDSGAGMGEGVNGFVSGFPGGTGNFTDSASTLWNSAASLQPYDIVILSCEGDQHEETKPQPALDAMKQYVDGGGRLFLSHWHNIWVGGGFRSGSASPVIPSWQDIAVWDINQNFTNAITDVIDEVNNPKGASFATWMDNVMGSTVHGEIPIKPDTGRATSSTLNTTKAERWTFIKDTDTPQNFQFTTPVDVSADQRCGKVVYSDMHVSGDGGTGANYPNSCGSDLTLSPQEKALAFMLFDLASCISVIL